MLNMNRMNPRPKLGMVAFATGLATLVCAAAIAAAGDGSRPVEEAALREAARWIQEPLRARVQYEYEMTARVRFLLFWVGRDDVGSGVIRRSSGQNPPGLEAIELLIGSDPAKAPRRINRWGAAMEVVRRDAGAPHSVVESVFFGFMTQARSDASASELEGQMSKEKSGKAFLYQGVLSRMDGAGGIARTVPFASDRDFDIHTYEEAKSRVFAELDGPATKTRRTEPGLQQQCLRVSGFLASVAELVDAALEGNAAGRELCYLHYGELYSLRLDKMETVAQKTISYDLKKEGKTFTRTYRNLGNMQFLIRNRQTGKKTPFELLVAFEGALRGAPVRITYQPNWWFQVILNLRPEESLLTAR
jgi:hypothetical protein